MHALARVSTSLHASLSVVRANGMDDFICLHVCVFINVFACVQYMCVFKIWLRVSSMRAGEC